MHGRAASASGSPPTRTKARGWALSPLPAPIWQWGSHTERSRAQCRCFASAWSPPRSFDASSMDDWCLSGNGPRASVSKIFGPGAEVLQGIKWLRHAAWADTTRGSGPEARFTHHSNAPRRYFDRIAAAAGVAFGLRCDRESRLCIETSKPPCLRPFPSLGAGSTPTRSSCGSACRSRTWWEATENRSVLGSAAPLARSNPDTRTRREGFRRAAHLWSPCPTCCHAHCRIGLRVARADRGRR